MTFGIRLGTAARDLLASARRLTSTEAPKLSPVEKEYCAAVARRNDRQLAWIAFWVGLAYAFLSLFLVRVIADRLNKELVLFACSSLIALQLGYLAIHRWVRIEIRAFVYLMTPLFVTLYAWTGYRAVVAYDMLRPVATMAFLGVSTLALIVCPLGLRFAAAQAALYAAMAVGIALAVEAGLKWLPVALISYGTTLFVSLVRRAIIDRGAIAEARARLLLAPAHIVRGSVDSAEPIEQLFKPRRRPCACVVLTRRDYEAAALSMAAAELVAEIEAHYAQCERLLKQLIPDGAYYLDPMVDELFVVVFADHGDEAFRLAFRFAQKLLEERRSGTATGHGQLDVGIAGGEVLVGIMGPKDQRKTTGLGEAPGRAARLRQAGLIVRRELGDSDRILLDAEGARLVGEELPAYDLRENEAVRDVSARAIHYWEAA